MVQKRRINDFLNECNDQGMPPHEFKNTLCSRCRNTQCVNAGWAGSLWENRISTQVERFLVNPRYADPQDPQFVTLRSKHFVEVAPPMVIRGQDPWAGPEIHLAVPPSESDTSGAVEAAVAALAGKPAPTPVAAPPTAVPVAHVAPPPVPPRAPAPLPAPSQVMNTDFPEDGLMLDGTPPPPPTAAPPPEDPWAPPLVRVVPVGARIKFGG